MASAAANIQKSAAGNIQKTEQLPEAGKDCIGAAAAGGGGGGTVVGAAGSSICSSSYCDAPRGSWSSSGCSSGRSSIDARGGTAATAYHSAFYHSSQLQQAGTPAAAAGPSCSTAAPAGSGAVGYHRLLPVQPGEEQHLSHHSLGFDPAASHSGLLAQQLQPSMFGATDLATAGSRSDLSLPLLLAHDGARLQLLQQLQQAPSALDPEEQINKELLWLLELRQRLTHTSPSASAASAAAAAGRVAAAADDGADGGRAPTTPASMLV